MSLPRSLLVVALAAAAAGAVTAVVYDAGDGLTTAALLVVCGTLVVGLSHVFARRRGRMGSLTRKFRVGVALALGLVIAEVAAVALFMFVSPHDAFFMVVLLAFAAGLAIYSATLLAQGLIRDIRGVRDGLVAVGEGRRDVEIATGASDELAELAGAANRMVEQLREREAERDGAEAARRDLVAAVSHDLRTPLTSMRLLSEALSDDMVDSGTRRRYEDQMAVQLESLSALIEDLFELSRLEAGDIQWSMQQVHLGELVGETVEAMHPQAQANGVAVHTAVPPDLAPAHANPEKLQRVLFNLIQNAIRHTPADGSVTVAAEANGTTVEVEVADTGEGVPAAERERVFDPFFRGGEGAARSGESTGLGLTISRAIVEAHGGMIWLAESDAGTRVRFSLPRAG